MVMLPYPRSSTEKEQSFVRTHQTACNRRNAPPPPLRSRLREKKRQSINHSEAGSAGSVLDSSSAVSTCSTLPSPTTLLTWLSFCSWNIPHFLRKTTVSLHWLFPLPAVLFLLLLRRLLLIQVSAEVWYLRDAFPDHHPATLCQTILF